jgi:uracil-DNA glycosylase family 4
MPKIDHPERINWTTHQANWNDCKGCTLCKGRSKVLLLRGSIPADILFIGEAPRIEDDVLKRPYSGAIGAYVDQVWNEALEETRRSLRRNVTVTCAYTNLVACVPREEGKWRKVTIEEKKECYKRLRETIILTQPIVIILYGKQVRKDFDAISTDTNFSKDYANYPVRELRTFYTVNEPSLITSAPIEVRGILHQELVVTVRDAMVDVIETPF